MNSEFLLYSLCFTLPLLTGITIFILRFNLIINVFLSIISIFIAFLSTFACWSKISNLEIKVLEILDPFYIDGFGLLMQFMVEIVTFFVILFSIREISLKNINNKHYLYFSTLLLSTGFMNLAFTLNNLFLMYIALELSSIISVYLIAFYLNRESLKAAFKYLLIVNVGILFSLLGIVLLTYASGCEISISNIGQNVTTIHREIALICAGLFIIGFFTKAGLVPFHAWLPDAYAEAPTAVTVFLAGAVTKIGFYGLARTVTIFAFNLEEIKILVITLSSLSILLGAILAFNQKDIKKLIAYCSISEMGFIASALALSSYTGIFGGIFHLINHTLMKGVLFFSTGILIYIYGTRKIDSIKITNKPFLALSFLIGALAVGGMPPFSSFFSSVTIIFALANETFLWASVLLALSGFISLIALLKFAISVFWEKKELDVLNNNASIPFIMILCAFLFAIMLIFIGIYPETLYTLIDNATMSILKTVR